MKTKTKTADVRVTKAQLDALCRQMTEGRGDDTAKKLRALWVRSFGQVVACGTHNGVALRKRGSRLTLGTVCVGFFLAHAAGINVPAKFREAHQWYRPLLEWTLQFRTHAGERPRRTSARSTDKRYSIRNKGPDGFWVYCGNVRIGSTYKTLVSAMRAAQSHSTKGGH